MGRRDNIFRPHRIFLIVNGTLCWWGSYDRRGNALRYLHETGSGLRAMLEVKKGYRTWHVKDEGHIRQATDFEAALLESLPVNYGG